MENKSISTSKKNQKTHFFDEVASTQNIAKEILIEDSDCQHWVVAKSQTEGRGRRGAHWDDAGLEALLFSVAFTAESTLQNWSLLPLLWGKVLVDSLNSFGDFSEELFVKWPNDVVCLKGQKLCKLAGVLIEGFKTNHYICGCGINLAGKSAISHAICAENLGVYLDPKKLLEKISNRFNEELQHWKSDYISYEKKLIDEMNTHYMKNMWGLVASKAGSESVRAVRLSASGELIVCDQQNKEFPLSTSELNFYL